MAGVPIKFRCFQCSQLLGVARSKAGTVVNCPKCAAGLIVPEPSEESESGMTPIQGAEPDAPANTRPSMAPLGLDELLSEIKIEDIRVEPGVVLESRPSTVNAREPIAFPELGAIAPEIARPIEVPGTDLLDEPSEVIAEPAETEDLVPAISFEQRKRVRIPEPGTRARDVVLPRSVALAWSLFVLLALTLAFVAGLLAGHFVWRIH